MYMECIMEDQSEGMIIKLFPNNSNPLFTTAVALSLYIVAKQRHMFYDLSVSIVSVNGLASIIFSQTNRWSVPCPGMPCSYDNHWVMSGPVEL